MLGEALNKVYIEAFVTFDRGSILEHNFPSHIQNIWLWYIL